MGNIIGSCYVANEGSYVKIIYFDGSTQTLTGKRHIAGEILFAFPESMLCDVECFFIGHAIPSLSIADPLKPGKTYLVLPLDIFPSDILSASSVAAFVRCKPSGTPTNLKDCPLEYIKRSNERVLIKVKPEFMVRYLTNKTNGDCDDQENDVTGGNVKKCCLCSTPELRKEYQQLVRSKDQTWSPGLDTISEANKIRYSPYRFIGLEWQEKEEDAKMGH